MDTFHGPYGYPRKHLGETSVTMKKWKCKRALIQKSEIGVVWGKQCLGAVSIICQTEVCMYSRVLGDERQSRRVQTEGLALNHSH